MTKILLLTSLFFFSLNAIEIPTKVAKMRNFSQNVELNGQIIQLPNASQSVMSQVAGHIEKYFVKEGQSVKKGQKIVMIESIMISKMTAEFVSLKKQIRAQEKNFKATQGLYKKGMTSLQVLNQQSIKKDGLLAKLTTLKSQLNTLGINTSNMKHASANFILYAHSDGVVSKILQSQHSSISTNTQIISLVKNKAYYLKSFLPLEYASKVKIGQKIVMHTNGQNIISHIMQILPKVDETTQRIVLLSSIDASADNLYINAYTSATLYFGTSKSYVSVEKSALSFFNNEWVVFVPTREEAKEEEAKKIQEDEEDEMHVPYEIRVINKIIEDEKFVGIEGLEVGEEYVNDKSYYVKSMLLKSSLGDGD